MSYNIEPQIVVNYLNDLLTKDPKSISTLVLTRIECKPTLADHPTCQVLIDPDTNKAEIGLLGIINGLVGLHEESQYGYIAAEVDLQDNVTRFLVTPETQGNN